MTNKYSQEQISNTTSAAIILAGMIIAIILVAGWVVTVYGQQNITEYHDLLSLPNEKMTPENYQVVKEAMLSGPYALVMNVTQDAANKTDGMMINQYVENIENQTKKKVDK